MALADHVHYRGRTHARVGAFGFEGQRRNWVSRREPHRPDGLSGRCSSFQQLRWPFALRVESLAQGNLKKPLKSVSISTRNRRKSPLGATRATFSLDFGRSKRLGRATRGASGELGRLVERLGATETVEVGCSGSVRSARARDPPRVPSQELPQSRSHQPPPANSL